MENLFSSPGIMFFGNVINMSGMSKIFSRMRNIIITKLPPFTGILDSHSFPWKCFNGKLINKTILGNLRFLGMIFKIFIPNIGI